MAVSPFNKPLFVSRPTLPPISSLSRSLKAIWKSQWLTNNGQYHQLLEGEIVRALKVPRVSLFNNGTTALLIACRSLGLSGDVITTPFTFSATTHVLAWNGVRPVFCDIDPNSMNIDASKIEALITPQTTGIMPVHVFGIPCEVDKIQDVADHHGLKIIYDAAHAFEVEIDGRGIGNFGDISMFSFHATKLFHTAEGGALTFRDPKLKEYADLAKNFGIINEDEVVLAGINGKMSELHAALGLEVLKLVSREIDRRRQLMEVYSEALSGTDGISWYKCDGRKVKNNHQYFVIRIDRKAFGTSRDFVYQEFKKFNVFARKYFYPLCSNMDSYRYLPSASPSALPVANRVANEVLMLPLYGGLSEDDIERICAILKSFEGKERNECQKSV